MRGRVSRPVLVTLVVVVTFFAYSMRAAAFMGIGDTGDVLLADIMANSIKALEVGSEQLRTMGQTYRAAQQVADLAGDAVRLTRSFGSFSVQRFGKRFYDDLNTAYPDVNYFRAEFFRTYNGGLDTWARGTGALDFMLAQCGADAVRHQPACNQLRQTLDSNKLISAIQDTFGAAPLDPRSQEEKQAAVIDAEVAGKLKALQAATIRYQKLEKQTQCLRVACQAAQAGIGAASLDPECAELQLDTSAASCAEMASLANVLAYEEQVKAHKEDLEQQRLQVLQLAAHNAELKRSTKGKAATVAAVSAETKNVARPIGIKSAGSFDFGDNGL